MLVRRPGLVGKLEDCWDGPYELIRKVIPVTYELSVPQRHSKSLVVHVNALKPWVDVEASVLRVVVADEDPEENSDGTGKLTAQQQKDIKIC